MSDIHHIAIAVEDLEEVAAFYEAAFGLSVSYRETIDSQGVRMAFLPAGETRIELIEPTTADSGVSKFLEKRGSGMHHIAIAVPDIEAALADLKAQGVRLIDEEPRIGAAGHRIAFVHPKSAHGVLIELVEEHE